ncbi:uncharacterized protein RSE6_10094 [Rhynchosporium secalis]|uniref:Uncharacterized protein n=1 Tax=Rhynchosporium secalis TaxID=38038 RepID=A0A1E1MJL9_RHYSE|nr:uncharacterized protein RSE6_10094 [Rhynchosporium secalis]
MACLRTHPNLPVPRRWIPLVFFTIFATILWIYSPVRKSPWSWPSDPSHTWRHSSSTSDRQFLHKPSEDDLSANIPITKVDFQPGVVKATGKPYTRTLIVPRTASEDTGWIQELVNKDKYFDYKVYVVDAKDAPLSPPKNKGHEVMVYLTYIIDHYHNLSDVNIFMHSHRHAWHSNELLDGDAVQIVSRLSSDRVQRDGYMNLRCHWDPGCPSWINLGDVEEDVGKQEQAMLAKSWSELFPMDPIPNKLAQPCCAQFALSRDRIRSLPLSKYVFFRDWLLETSMSDYFSGRVFEYIWHFIFTGRNAMCPREHVCYCDGFGICFGGEEEYDAYQEKIRQRKVLEEELRIWNQVNTKWDAGDKTVDQPEVGKNTDLSRKIDDIVAWCKLKKREAIERGDAARYRAHQAERIWNEGDSF